MPRARSGDRGGGPSPRPVVATSAGAVRGRVADGVARFLAIPYAAPPVGARRFRPPAAHPGWSGVRDAVEPGGVAPQPGAPSGREEAALRLNVTAPTDGDGPLPVLVWVHGGGFTSGAAEASHTRPHHLARRGVVVVTVGYRLGVLGWLHLGHVSPDHPDSGNLGLLDQAAALRWVADNIEAFGGDPTRITVAGHSAGAMGVAALMALAPGTFGAAILQSGAADHVLAADEAAAVGDRVMRALGTADPRSLTDRPVAELLDAQGAVAAELAREWTARPRPGRFLAFAPVAGTPALPVDPLTALRQGRIAPIPLIVGANLDEERSLIGRGATEDRVRRWLEALAVPDVDAVWSWYAARLGGAPDVVLAAMRTDLHFRLPAARLARTVTGVGGVAWHYDLRWPSSLPGFGAAHGLELRFVFGTLGDEEAAATHAGAPAALAALVQAAWCSLATHGSPAAAGRRWAPHGSEGCTLVLDAEPRHERAVTAEAAARWGPRLAPA